MIAQNLEGFKDQLKTVVGKWGAINKLARETARNPTKSIFQYIIYTKRTTLYRIAAALNLSEPEKEIITDWAA